MEYLINDRFTQKRKAYKLIKSKWNGLVVVNKNVIIDARDTENAKMIIRTGANIWKNLGIL